MTEIPHVETQVVGHLQVDPAARIGVPMIRLTRIPGITRRPSAAIGGGLTSGPHASPATSSQQSSDVFTQLTKLDELRHKGIILRFTPRVHVISEAHLWLGAGAATAGVTLNGKVVRPE